MYTLIHPTKCGGTACELFLSENYSDFVFYTGHKTLCTNNNNPIIIVRDVLSRFFSMFKYWKYGGDYKYRRDEKFLSTFKNVTILDFICLLKNNRNNILCKDFTWEDHFKPTTHWINNTDYENIIVIKYERDLNEKIQCLLEKLKIPNKGIVLPHINCSYVTKQDWLLFIKYREIIENFIKDFFKEDIEFLACVENNPELFKLVI